VGLDRDDFQDLLSDLNPSWKHYADDLQSIGQEVKTNPDGDADVREKSFDSFVVPNCEKCTTGLLKPAVNHSFSHGHQSLLMMNDFLF
jgi:hypothetical protein